MPPPFRVRDVSPRGMTISCPWQAFRKPRGAGLSPLFPVLFVLVQIWYPIALWADNRVMTPVNTYFITLLSGKKVYSFI
jgi:hypothetical protein